MANRSETTASWIRGSSNGAAVLLALALLGMVNYLGARHYERFDWTRSRLYTLSEKSANLLSSLDRAVDVVVFMSPEDELYEPVRELLSRYAAASDLVRVREVDPDRNLVEAQKLVDDYSIDRQNVVVFATDDDRRVVDSADLAEYDFSGAQYGQAPTQTAFKGEQQFTGALIELMEDEKPKLVFTTGHGEASLDDSHEPRGLGTAQDLLGRDNFEIEIFPSLGADAVPEGTDLVVVAGPTAPFTEPELDLLRTYLAGGGRVLVLLDPDFGPGGIQSGHEALEGWLAEYGVAVGRDVVVDPAKLLPFFGAETIFADGYTDHPVTRSLDQAGIPVVLSLARSVGRAEPPAGVTVTEILRTSSEGWGETDLERLPDVELDASDTQGPVPLMVAVELSADVAESASPPESPGAEEVPAAEPSEPAEGGRFLVVGDADFIGNGQLGQVGNATLAVSAMNWLVERESHLGIDAKTPEQVRLSLSAAEMSGVRWLVLVLMPGIGVVLGILVSYRRRR